MVFSSKTGTRVFRAIILGAPGSGKGTISARIIRDFHLRYLAAGDVFRHHVKEKTDLGIKVQKYMDNGELVPDRLSTEVMLEEIRERLEGQSWLLDGFPRTVAQAKHLYAEKPVDVCISLEVPFEIIISRIKGRWVHPGSGRVYNDEFNPPHIPGKDDVTLEPLIQREDDKPDVVLRRLQQYEEATQPVTEFYKKHGVLEEFHGTESNKIWPHVRKFLSSLLTPVEEHAYG